ncbi:MAG TPA: 16S rRNA (cytidine(1402)-2'-O)-methyltransferase [Candidatus Saccharimonadales bacterium]|nr:16S rRNA (cytidine(1402)-2'-O)-methyltransferase [Candidatus Saccharimonadales bacterium]
MQPGTLYIVATPIGNLEDITLRALETLKSVDVIYAEDTRHTGLLLAHFGIKKPLHSYHHHSQPHIVFDIQQRLEKGDSIAYVTDAGTPGIADPVGKLVEYIRKDSQATIVPIPGPSAITALLSVAGLPANSYWFAGYVPTKKGRQTFIKKVLAFEETVVVFETAPRIQKFFDQLTEFGGEQRYLVVGRELTKKFEQIVAGFPPQLKADFSTPKGEFVVVLAPKNWQKS